MVSVNLRSIAAGLVLAILLAVSLGGAVCDASCISIGEQQHGCCPAQSTSEMSSSMHDAVIVPAGCAHPPQMQTGLVTAPVFLIRTAVDADVIAPVRSAVASAARAVPATTSPPIFPLRI